MAAEQTTAEFEEGGERRLVCSLFFPPVFSVSLCFTEQMKSVQRSNLEDKFIDTPDKMEKGREIELEKDKLDEM